MMNIWPINTKKNISTKVLTLFLHSSQVFLYAVGNNKETKEVETVRSMECCKESTFVYLFSLLTDFQTPGVTSFIRSVGTSQEHVVVEDCPADWKQQLLYAVFYLSLLSWKAIPELQILLEFDLPLSACKSLT